MRHNRLNDLEPRQWIKFQKSWFIHNPPPRDKRKLLHPAAFPEDLVQEFICFFTKRGQWVLDPFLGTGSTLIACARSGRNGIGIELAEKYARIADQRVADERRRLGLFDDQQPEQRVVVGDAMRIVTMDMPPIDYCITSPPYWDMLRRKGFETQRSREESGLDVYYSDDPYDLGNIEDYTGFVNALRAVFVGVYEKLRDGAYLTIIVKNVKKGGRMYPLAWDLGLALSDVYQLRDEKIWCQDNQRLAPFGMGNAWVSNTHHHYCLNFRKA